MLNDRANCFTPESILSRSFSLLGPVPSIISSNFSQLFSASALSRRGALVCERAHLRVGDLPELYGHLWRLDKVA